MATVTGQLLRRLTMILLGAVWSLSSDVAEPERQSTLKEVMIGFETVTVEEAQAGLGAFLGPGEFFNGVKRVDGPNGPLFLKNGKEVERFPERVDCYVRIVFRKRLAYILDDPPLPREASTFAESLVVNVTWKRGMNIRGIEGVKVQRSAPANKTWGEIWEIRLTIPAKDVPLTDHLLVCLTSPDGKLVARFSARF